MILPELIQHLGCAGRNVSIKVITLVFVESRHCLSNGNNVLVDTEFANARQPIFVNNRRDMQD